MKKKETPSQKKKKRKISFFSKINGMTNDNWQVIKYPHFIKIIKGDVMFDYYPGAQKINRRNWKGSENNWRDLTIESFLEKFNFKG